MSLRPIRPSNNNTRPFEDDGNNTDKSAEPPRARIGLGPPIATPTMLSRTKRATCLQCRSRKVRCDGREGTCQNCDRLEFECSFNRFPDNWMQLGPGRYALKSPERRRRMQACIPCHVKKTRCHGELPSCSSCVRKGRECVYPKSRIPGVASATNIAVTPDGGYRSSNTPWLAEVSLPPIWSAPDRENSSSKTVEGSLEDIHIVESHIEDYFHYLYPLPSFAFLHRSTVIRRCRDGTINESLKLAICAVTSLHLQRTSLEHHLWAQQAEEMILHHISRPSIFHLQALLLVIRYRIESGEFPTAFMLAALAARMAVALRLNYERAELVPVAQEARRRLYWALYLLDDYFCVGLREFELCPEETIHLQLPCHEDIFEAGRACRTGTLRQPNIAGSEDVAALGLRGVFIRLTSVRRAVMRFNRRVGLSEESPSGIGKQIRQFEGELRCLLANLDPAHRYSVLNLASCKWPAQFVMLHMSYYQCLCDLYRMFLNGYSEAAPSGLLASICAQDRERMQAQCFEHAEKIIRILDDFMVQHAYRSQNRDHAQDISLSSPTLLLMERDAAVCAFEGARLIMFGARFFPTASSSITTPELFAPELSVYRARSVSLRFITEFFPFSASTRPLRTALEYLISSYSTRLTTATQPQPPQSLYSRQQQPQTVTSTTTTKVHQQEPLFSEPSSTSARPSESKISQYAESRQRLSVQSLLLQSDFVDDSHEIAGGSLPSTFTPPSRSIAFFPPPNNNNNRNDATTIGNIVEINTPEFNNNKISNPTTTTATMPTIASMLIPTPTESTTIPQITHPSANNDTNKTNYHPRPQQNPPPRSDPHPTTLTPTLTLTPARTPSPSTSTLIPSTLLPPFSSLSSPSSSPTPWAVTPSSIDARREDVVGLICNPWMGYPFTGAEDLYGLGEDY